MINADRPARYDCVCSGNTCRCTDKPDARPSTSLALDGPITASAADVHQMLTRSAFAGPLLDNYNRALRTGDRALGAHLAGNLRQLARQYLRAANVAHLDTALVASGMDAPQTLALLMHDPASGPLLGLRAGCVRRGEVIQASKYTSVLRHRAANLQAELDATARTDAMNALEARVYATNPQAGDWARLKRRAQATKTSRTNGTNGKAHQS